MLILQQYHGLDYLIKKKKEERKTESNDNHLSTFVFSTCYDV